MANYVKFKQGLKKDFNTTNQPLTNGMIYFVIDENNNGSIYYDTIVDGKNATKNGTVHRVKFSGLPIKITGSIIGTGVISQDGETIEINTSTNHSHGLAHQDFTVTLSDDNTNLKWTRLGNQNGGGFWLKSIRGQTKAPAWFLPDYSAGIAFGGEDTKGVISVRYSQPGVRFAGGDGDAPVWYFTITGANDKTYDLSKIGGHSSDSAKLDHNVTFKIASSADATKGGSGTATNLSGSAVDLYLPTKISGFDLLQASRFQGNADTSTVAAKLGRGGNTSLPMTFNWSGQDGQPTWLWGGENGTDMYVYNPSNFRVAHSVSTAGLDHDVTFKISKVANATTGETGVVTKLTEALLELILPASISGFNLIQSTRFQGNADSATVASRANSLFLNPSNRQENINYQINSDQYQSRVTYSLASSITKTGKPPVGDSHVLTFGWDGSGLGAQLAITADAKPHIAIRGAKAGEKGVSIWDETWSTVLDSSNYTSYINNYYWADVKVSTTANEKTNPNFFNVTSSGWFFSNAPSTGWQNSAHGGGIYMKDNSYVRIYGGKKFAVENTDFDSINTTGGVKASGGFTSDAGTMKVYAESNNEINFGGTNPSNTIYFGYRKKDSKEIPSIFIFGSDTGTANIQANAGWFGQKYLSGDNWIGWYAAKGDTSSKRYGYIQTDISDNGNMRFVKEGGGYFTFNSHVNPNQTNAYDLGTQALAWRTLYVNNLNLYGQTANRLVWTNEANAIRASHHYAASDRIAINSTSAPEYNFYVNGTSLHTNTITINPNTVAMDFRNDDAYHTTISYQTAGNEALVFASKNSVTSFMFVNGEDSIANHGSDRWNTLTPGLQIKQNCVSIGERWASSTDATHKLRVNGTSYFHNGDLRIDTSAGTYGLYIRRTSDEEAVKHWVDDSYYHLDYTNDETFNGIAFRFINTDTENNGGGANASDRTIYLDSNCRFYTSVADFGDIGQKDRYWLNAFIKNINSSTIHSQNAYIGADQAITGHLVIGDDVLQTTHRLWVKGGTSLFEDNIWLATDKFIGFKGVGQSTSTHTQMGYANKCLSGSEMHSHGNHGANTAGAFYIQTNGYGASSDTGGLAIDNEGVTVFGGGDASDNLTGVFRVINEDAPANGPMFNVQKTGDTFIYKSLGINGANDSYNLYVNGTAYFNGQVTATQFNGPLNGNATSATKLVYGPVLDSDDAINSFHAANTFQAALWNNTRSPGHGSGIILDMGWSNATYGAQLAIDDDPNYFIALRQRDGDGWKAWKTIPMGDGTGASGTWDISITGNAATATKLQTARNIILNGNLQGSASFNGTGDATITALNYQSWVDGGNTHNYPWHRIATTVVGTGEYRDKSALLRIRHTFHKGGEGLVKVSVRTNSTGSDCSISAIWLYRYNIDADDIGIGLWGITGDNVYLDVYYKYASGWPRAIVESISNGRIFTLISSNEADDTTTTDKKTSSEVYTSIEDGATLIHGKAYTKIVYGSDGNDNSKYVLKTGDTMTGMLRVNNAPIFGYRYGQSNNAPAFIFDKPSSHYTGIGANGNDDTIYFGAVDSSWNWVTSYKQQWVFNGNITADKVYGAVWNDYAEYRSTSTVNPGQCVVETGLGDLVQSTKRLQPGANIVSDTFGFAIGETEKTKTPIAISGRVLAYPYEDRDSYKAGDPVCSGPNGTISKMTRKEVREYPDRIVGTVSEIPKYETWGTGNVKVNGRIWIKVK